MTQAYAGDIGPLETLGKTDLPAWVPCRVHFVLGLLLERGCCCFWLLIKWSFGLI